MGGMAARLFQVECPCCTAKLKIDPETRSVISHQAPPEKRTVEDLNEAMTKLKGEEARRDQLFRDQFEAQKTHGKVLEKKFEELFKQAQSDPDKSKPRVRDIDLD
jgi:hypothetical protein